MDCMRAKRIYTIPISPATRSPVHGLSHYSIKGGARIVLVPMTHADETYTRNFARFLHQILIQIVYRLNLG